MDGVRMAVISNRFDAVVNSMMNTIFRSGRSGVLNSAHDFSCCVLSAQHQLVMGAESLPIHMMSGPDLIARAVLKVHPELRRGDAYLHNNPYNGNSHPADHAMFVPVIDEQGVHRFRSWPRPTRPTAETPSRRRTWAGQRTSTRRARCCSTPCRVQSAYADNEDILRMCDCGSASRSSGGATTSRCSERPGRRAARARARRRARLGRARDVRRRLVRLQRAADAATRSRRLPAGRVRSSSRHDPFPGIPDGVESTRRSTWSRARA